MSGRIAAEQGLLVGLGLHLALIRTIAFEDLEEKLLVLSVECRGESLDTCGLTFSRCLPALATGHRINPSLG